MFLSPLKNAGQTYDCYLQRRQTVTVQVDAKHKIIKLRTDSHL